MSYANTTAASTADALSSLAALAGSRPAPAAARTRNHLLAALPPAEYTALAPHLEQVELAVGQLLHPFGAAPAHVWFPEGAVAVVQLADGASVVEVATLGRESAVGAAGAIGFAADTEQLVIRVPGSAARIGAETLRELAATLPVLRELLDRHASALLARHARAAHCNRSHPIEQRLAVLLLQVADAAGAEHFALTHQQLGTMLGVRRAGVTEAAVRLRREGVIDYERGRVVVRDRARLLAEACGCYRAVREAYAAVERIAPPASQLPA